MGFVRAGLPGVPRVACGWLALAISIAACQGDATSNGGAGGGGGTGQGAGGARSGQGGSGAVDAGPGGGAGGADAGRAVDAAADVPIGPRPPVTAAPGATLVKVNPAVRYQTFEGWGASLAWCANNVGGWRTAARDAVVDVLVDPVAGLGYNIFRYNIGGGENPAHDHMGAFKEMPGFEPSAGTFTWDADANQRGVLQR